MRKRKADRKRETTKQEVRIPEASYKLLEYIDSIGVTRSSYGLRGIYEPRFKLGPLGRFQVTK